MARSNGALSVRELQSIPHFPRRPYDLTEKQFCWGNAVERRFEELVKLAKGWDGYRGVAVPFETAHFAMRLLETICPPDCPMPDIVPGAGGEVQLEWYVNGAELEIFIRSPNDVLASRSYADNEDKIEEEKLANDFSLAAEWIGQLTETCRASARPAQR